MKWHYRGLASASLAVFLACCGGRAKPERPQAPEWHPAVAMLDKYANKDGVLTRAALEAGLHADFAGADVNHDGCLDDKEIRTVNEQRWRDDASTASPLIDFKHNGCVDFDEYAATPRSLFEQMDKSGDGRLTPDELHPGHKAPANVPSTPAPPA
jgi:hypothetical protein